jgi:hypothetical protein
MGNKLNQLQIAFDDVQHLIQNKSSIDFEFYFIHTLLDSEQSCLILHTLESHEEVRKINDMLVGGSEMNMKKQNVKLFIYGRNANDPSVYTKYKQLIGLGFQNVYIYAGGIFEWLLLQDIYGQDMFPTSGQPCIDFLKFKPKSMFFSQTDK